MMQVLKAGRPIEAKGLPRRHALLPLCVGAIRGYTSDLAGTLCGGRRPGRWLSGV